jgi:uncharacterized protein (DUF2062 family)
MFVTVAGVSLVVTIVAFGLDSVAWSFVFNTGMEHLVTMTMEEAKPQMGALLAKQFANTLLFGIGFTVFYTIVRGALPAGVVGGLLFAILLWLPSVAHQAIGNNIWYGKAKALAKATALSALAKCVVSGVIVALLIH